MKRAGHYQLLAGCGLGAGILAGCNVLFGITAGVADGSGGAGGTGATTTSASTSMSACGPYEGNGLTYLTDVSTSPAPNVPTLVMGNSGSVSGTYVTTGQFTEFKLGADPAGYCGGGLLLDIAGMPAVGDYVVVDKGPLVDVAFTQGPPLKAYVLAGVTPLLPDGGCDEPRSFGSVAGTGKVTVTAVKGQTVTFTVTGVQATGISDPTCAGQGGPCDGQGTIQLDVKGGESDCFTVE